MTLDKLTDEAGRLASLRRYDLLDTAPEAPFDKITHLVKTILNVPIAAVTLVDADRQWFKSCVGLDNREGPRDSSFCTHTIKTLQPMIIGDAKNDPKFCDNALVVGPPYIGAYAGAPLITPDGYALGSLCAIDTVARQFQPWQIDALKSFAALVVDEFELRRLAQTDGLTGALNRRAFLLEGERAIAQYFAAARPSAIISFDLDHFEPLNNAHGYAVGDLLLSACAALAGAPEQPGESLARLGGDEFALLLPGAGREQAMQAAEHLRAALAALRIPEHPELRLTASFGVAVLTPAGVTAEKWLAEADAALAEAKRSGRDRCVQAAGLPEPEEDIYILRREQEAVAPLEEEFEDADEEFEQHRNSIEPLSRDLWSKMQRSRRVKTVTTGRLAYGGLNPGLISCQILNLTETGLSVETFARLSPIPDVFSVEFGEIFCRARTRRSEGHELELEFIFDGV